MQGQDNIISFSGSALPHLSVRLNAKSQQVVSQSRVVVMRWLSKLMRVLFEQLDDTLYEHADRSSDNALQSSYFDAMRVLRKQRHFIDNQFVQQVLCRFDGYWQPDQVDVMRPLGQEQSPDAKMDLVTDDELEDGLAVANMIAKNENRYAGEISALGQRFFYLLSGGRQGLGGLLEKSPLKNRSFGGSW